MANLSLPTRPSRAGLPWELVGTKLAAEAITAGMTVVLNSSGQLIKADADTHSAYAWVALNTAATGEPVDFIAIGYVTGFSGMTPGTVYYLSASGGYICPVEDLSGNLVPVGVAYTADILFVAPFATQLPNNTVVIATPSRGDLIYRGASAWSKLAAGTKGQFPMTGGSGADPSYADPRIHINYPARADIGANTTVTIPILKVPTGRKYTVLHLGVYNGTTADATVQLKADSSGICTATALTTSTWTEVTTFTDTVDAGEVLNLVFVTAETTGDLDAAQAFIVIADRPA